MLRIKSVYFIGTLFLVLFFTCTCSREIDNRVKVIEGQSFIMAYHHLEENLTLSKSSKYVVEIRGENERFLPYRFEVPQTPDYEMLSKKNGDMSYNRIFRFLAFPHHTYSASAVHFTGLDIYCTTDYNATHPIGTSLNDITRFMSISLYPFIKSGYTKTFDITTDMDKLSATYKTACSALFLNHESFQDYSQFEHTSKLPVSPIEVKVQDLKTDDMKLLGMGGHFSDKHNFYIGYLYFEELPETSGEYEIVVKLYGDDGKTYSGSITMNF